MLSWSNIFKIDFWGAMADPFHKWKGKGACVCLGTIEINREQNRSIPKIKVCAKERTMGQSLGKGRNGWLLDTGINTTSEGE